MDELGYKRKTIRYHFGSLTGLCDVVKLENPKLFNLEHLFTKENADKIRKEVRSYKKFIVTTAVVGCEVDPAFYASIKTYCKKNNAKLLILPSADPAAQVSTGLDPAIIAESIVFENLSLNSKLSLQAIRVSAKMILPTTGLDRIGSREGSFIYASPKQFLNYTPVDTNKLSHCIMTTGAITNPDYRTDRYLSQRTATIAEIDHVKGAIVVEIENSKFYHFRQIQANKDGSFSDLGTRYYENGDVVASPISALIPGDIHVGSTDPAVKKVIQHIAKTLKPKHLILHDLFDGDSINVHESHMIANQIKKHTDGMSLEKELSLVASELTGYSKLAQNVVVVRSNHDIFLDRYLQSGAFINDYRNTKESLYCMLDLIDGKNPLKGAVERRSGLLKNVKWLTENCSYRIHGIECGQHGHRGANGAKGSIISFAKAFGKSVTGHTHTPRIYFGAFQTGTSTFRSLPYAKGPSSWVQTLCIINADGSRQLINVINGKYRM